jgi:hypothetical protein
MALFTLLHVLISLVAIAAGFVVSFALLKANVPKKWTTCFLSTTIATSVTGFLFPFHHFTPAHGVGIISLLVLAVASYAIYGRHLVGASRWVYAVSAILALYLNFFVLVVQLFQKVPPLQQLAPTQTEGPFVIAQAIAAVFFVGLGIMAAVKFRVASTQPA